MAGSAEPLVGIPAARQPVAGEARSARHVKRLVADRGLRRTLKTGVLRNCRPQQLRASKASPLLHRASPIAVAPPAGESRTIEFFSHPAGAVSRSSDVNHPSGRHATCSFTCRDFPFGKSLTGHVRHASARSCSSLSQPTLAHGLFSISCRCGYGKIQIPPTANEAFRTGRTASGCSHDFFFSRDPITANVQCCRPWR